MNAKFSSSITSGDKNRAWQEIASIVNAGNSANRDIKEIQKKWDNICATAKTEVSLHLSLSINSKSWYISNGLVLSLKIRSLLIDLLASSIRYRLTWNIVMAISNLEMSLYGQWKCYIAWTARLSWDTYRRVSE